jgi:hypothetical protein
MPSSGEKDRPSASGHRFGPDLSCSECGITWDEHQAEPGPCNKSAGTPPIEPAPSGSVRDGSVRKDQVRDDKAPANKTSADPADKGDLPPLV